MTIQVKESLMIERPIEDVFAFISDLENLPLWTSSLDKVTKVSDGPISVGIVFHEEGQFMGRKVDSRREITVYEPPTKLSFVIREGSIPGQGTYIFEPVADSTKLTFIGKAEPGRLIELLSPLFSRLMKRQFLSDGRRLKELLEKSGASPESI